MISRSRCGVGISGTGRGGGCCPRWRRRCRWEGAEALSELKSAEGSDDVLAGFARKLSRQPWQMEAGDLERLRAAGYSEEAVLHAISVVAHQNADSRLVAGLRAAGRT